LIKPGENGAINMELEGNEHYRFTIAADMGSFAVRLQRQREISKEGIWWLNTKHIRQLGTRLLKMPG
jgi:hypothetical protein